MPRTTHEAVGPCARSTRRAHERRTSYPVDYPASTPSRPAEAAAPEVELRPLLPRALFWPAWTDRDVHQVDLEPQIWPAIVDRSVLADSRPELPLHAFPAKEGR